MPVSHDYKAIHYNGIDRCRLPGNMCYRQNENLIIVIPYTIISLIINSNGILIIATLSLSGEIINNYYIMKKLLILTALAVFFTSCEKEEKDLANIAVEIFVKGLKSGTLNDLEEQLFIIAEFNESHIQPLIEMSKDTIHIPSFPLNPLIDNPLPEGRDYFILGECLLWVVEGIRSEMHYLSIDPFLIDTRLIESERIKGITGKAVLTVRDAYKDWWNNFRNKDWKGMNPLEESHFRWN
jgi:hypothetical protein